MEDFKEVLFKMNVIKQYVEEIADLDIKLFLNDKGDLIVSSGNIFEIVKDSVEFPNVYVLTNYIIENIGAKV